MKIPRLFVFTFIVFVLIFTVVNPISADTTHDGDIVLTGDEVLVIEDTAYTQTGNIYIRDNATLTIKNATLIMNMRYHEEFSIYASGNATLEIIDSTFSHSMPYEVIAITFTDLTTLNVQNSNINPVMLMLGERSGGDYAQPTFKGIASISQSELGNLNPVFSSSGGAKIVVSDSDCKGLTLAFQNYYEGEFSNLKPGLFDMWTYRENNYDITIQNTRFYNDINIVCEGPSAITIRDSDIFQFAPYVSLSTIFMKAVNSKINHLPLVTFQATMDLKDLNAGFYDYFSLRDHATGTGIPNVILENTEIINGWYLFAAGDANLTIDNATMVRLRVGGDNNILNVTNSKTKELFLYQATNSKVSLDNITIDLIDLLVPPNEISIEGNMTFAAEAYIRNWISPSTINRTYPVITGGYGGTNVPVADLALYDKDGILVWSGQTDPEGKVSFDIEFNDNNHDDNWTLEMTCNGMTTSRDITLLTSTPIDIIPPDPPAAVSASKGTYPDKVHITWSPSYGATSYDVYRGTTWTGTKTWIGTSSSSSYDDTSVAPGTTYYYWVTAKNTYGTSDYSSYDTGYLAGATPPIQWVTINGTIEYDGTPLCAMVLANGQHLFTCGNNPGLWDLEVPLDQNGKITLFGFCSGLAPFKATLTPDQAQNFDIAMTLAPPDSQEMEATVQTEAGTTNPNYVRISGTVAYEGTPLCAMVLANGQSMFTCGNNLGTFDLEVPLDGNGEITLFVFCSGLAPYKEVFIP